METDIISRPRQINWEKISATIFYGLLFLLPVFVLPWKNVNFMFGKALLFYAGIALAFLFWLLANLQKGEIRFPKSALFLPLAGMAIVWFASSFFSGNSLLSLIGRGFEIDTFLFVLFGATGLFLVSNLFCSEQQGLVFYITLLFSSLIVFLFQFFHTLFEFDIIPLKIFSSSISNLIGGWNDFGIFFGFICLTSLVLFQSYRFKKLTRILLMSSIFLSLLAMMAVNFLANWIILGSFTLLFFVFIFYKSFYGGSDSVLAPEMNQQGRHSRNFILPVLVFAIIVLFILAKGTMADFTTYLRTSFVEARPSWGTTFDIVEQTLKENPVLGSGPNTFLYDWLKHKPLEINSTIFWNTRFISGIGHLPSMVATVGILGLLSLLAFLSFVLYYGLKVVSYDKDDLLRALLMSSFLGSVYLWCLTLFYSPGLVIFALAFLSTGLLVAMLVRAEKIKVIELSFFRSAKVGFVSVLAIVLLIIGSISSFYLLLKKTAGAYYYNSGLDIFAITGDLENAEAKMIKSLRFDQQDEYYRALSEVNLVKIQQILSDTNLPAEQAQVKFKETLANSIQYAQEATKMNSKDPLNWMQLGRIYEAIIPLKITGADNMAVSSYEETVLRSPSDPLPLMALARIEAQSGKTQEARNYLQSTLAVKSDFAPALFLLSQIEVYDGNLVEAIKMTEQTAMLAPNDVGVLFQLGLLYYQNSDLNSSGLVFEKVVSLNPNYANARYFLGLIYDKAGMKEKAIEQFENIQSTNPDNQEVKNILSNLHDGKVALEGISPPAKAPEKREIPPITEKYKEDAKNK